MKANHKSLWKKDDRAQVGIGTMIVFIATILVAATAAAVLIDTSGKLQERSSQTGDQATKQVASNLIVKTVTGERTSSSDIHWLNITVALAPGAKTVDMEQLKIQISDGSAVQTFDWASVEADNTFQLDSKRDVDTSGNTMTAGDLMNVQIDLKRITFSTAVRTDVDVTLIPEVGSPADASYSTPESFGTNTLIFLR